MPRLVGRTQVTHWWHIIAAVVLVAVLAIVFWPSGNTERQVSLQRTIPEARKTETQPRASIETIHSIVAPVDKFSKPVRIPAGYSINSYAQNPAEENSYEIRLNGSRIWERGTCEFFQKVEYRSLVNKPIRVRYVLSQQMPCQ